MKTKILLAFCFSCSVFAGTLPSVPTVPVIRTIPAVPLLPPPAPPAPRPEDKEWWFHPRKNHVPSGAPEDINFRKYQGRFLGDAKRNVVYLTFDEGSETGCTPRILETLKANGVHATFFVTRFYMKEAPGLLKQILAEGHAVGNHSATHPAHMGRLSADKIQHEITATADTFKQLTGREMPPLFRPPCGACDERILRVAAALGQKTVFWSMAYADYLPTQKTPQYALDFVMKYHHPGAIILLHPYEANTRALDGIIKGLRAAGYEFGTLADLLD